MSLGNSHTQPGWGLSPGLAAGPLCELLTADFTGTVSPRVRCHKTPIAQACLEAEGRPRA